MHGAVMCASRCMLTQHGISYGPKLANWCLCLQIETCQCFMCKPTQLRQKPRRYKERTILVPRPGIAPASRVILPPAASICACVLNTSCSRRGRCERAGPWRAPIAISSRTYAGVVASCKCIACRLITFESNICILTVMASMSFAMPHICAECDLRVAVAFGVCVAAFAPVVPVRHTVRHVDARQVGAPTIATSAGYPGQGNPLLCKLLPCTCQLCSHCVQQPIMQLHVAAGYRTHRRTSPALDPLTHCVYTLYRKTCSCVRT